MIGHLRGTIARREPGLAVVDVHGVGYVVHVTHAEPVPARGQPWEVFTLVRLRDEVPALYGFSQRASLELFELLIAASGVGPKLALAVLGTLRPDALRSAIIAGDLAALTAVPGVGRKVAERLVLELRDHLGGLTAGDHADAGLATAPEHVDEVAQALAALGYTASEVRGALDGLAGDAAAGTPDPAELLRAALRYLSSSSNGAVPR